MEHMSAYDVAVRIASARGWDCRPQSFGGTQARLMVEAEDRWLGISTASSDSLVLLHAGHILTGGTPTNPVAESSATSTHLAGVLGEVEVLWQQLDADGKSL
ncbi:hypothetical protein [Streptomyces sp. OR43]|uniref:hypothetical protein n=1 Tax=Streptomyces sp. or43 TaxID=2478957 RepID=UPI0011CE7017|nr:hypothetical protein [Streptomyces sp. or43]